MKTTIRKIILFALVCISSLQLVRSQNKTYNSIPLIGEEAPAFTAETTMGTLKFPDDFGTKWKILFSHPADFTPVCTSEIMQLASMQQEFNNLNVALAVISTDDISLHESWVKSMDGMIYNGGDPIKIKFPIIDDSKFDVSKKYGMISPTVDSRRTVRAVFVIDPKNNVQAIFYYPKNVGRNLDEIKRTVIALQTADQYAILTPANWKQGDDVLLPYPYPFTCNDSIQKADAGMHNISWYMMYKKQDK